MDCCFEPGQVLILPEDGGRETLSGVFERRDLGKPDILYSVEDILKHYHLGHEKPLIRFRSYPVLARVPPGQEEVLADKLRGFKEVAAALPNYHARPSLVGLNYNSDYISESLIGSGLEVANRECGSGVTVAVLDSGVDSSVFDDTKSYPPQFDTDAPRDLKLGLTPYDATGHGTVVASLIRRGAPGATLLPIKVMTHRGNLMGVVAGLYAAIAAYKPEIFNLSLSLTCETGTCAICGQPFSESPVTLEQLALLFGQVDQIYRFNGLSEPLLVAAAGNVWEGAPLSVPACLDDVLAVGACESSARPAEACSYSRYGAVPRQRFVRAPGGQDHPERSFGTLGPFTGNEIPTQWHQERFYGTSFAAPLATAVAARYLCITKASPCGDPKGQFQRPTRPFLMQCLREGADSAFGGFDASVHGLGRVRYQLEVAQAVVNPLSKKRRNPKKMSE